jgi:UDP-glucose 4-epimerase
MAVCLVTGGAGFIGSHLVEALVREGHRVRVLDNFSTGKVENLTAVADDIDLISGDVCHESAVAQAVSGCELVFHQAALASVPRSLEDPLATHAACATGTLVVLHEARKAGVRRVVYAASSSAYGNQPHPEKRETDLPSPLSPYAAAKLAGEMYCAAFWHSYGLQTVALRYFNVFGPRQDPRGPYAAVIPLFILALLEGRSPVIYGDGRQTRDFVHVGDVAAAAALALRWPRNVTWNVACGRAVSVLELAHLLGQLLDMEPELRFLPGRPGDVRRSVLDPGRLIAAGWGPPLSLREGLRRLVAETGAVEGWPGLSPGRRRR